MKIQGNKMETMPMTKLVLNMSLPLMVSLLVQSLYNIVDGIFVAKISEEALTATSLAFPIQLLMIAVSVGTSVGVNALLSKNVGAKNHEMLTNIAMTGLILSLISALVFAILGLTCTNWFAEMFTENSEISDLCSQYLSICMIFCFGVFVQTMFQRFLQAVGDTFNSMVSLITGAVINIILDPIMIFGLLGCPALGIRGAAIATVIGQWVGAIVVILLNTFKNPTIKVTAKGYHVDKKVVGLIYKVGLPTIVMQSIGSIMVAAINAILMPFSSTSVAFFGVYYKLQSFLFMPINGLGQAAIPIVGYNYGAQNKKRIMEVFKSMIPIAVGISLAATVIFMLIPSELLKLFSASEQMLKTGVPALRIISVTFVLASVTIILGYAVSGLGNGIVNMLGTALRQLIVLVPFVFLLVRILGVDQVWFSFWISEVTAVLYAIFSTRKILHKKDII